jgi:hypothetical protein
VTVVSEENRNAFTSLSKNNEKKKKSTVCESFELGQEHIWRARSEQHFTVLLLDLCLETGSLFGPLLPAHLLSTSRHNLLFVISQAVALETVT